MNTCREVELSQILSHSIPKPLRSSRRDPQGAANFGPNPKGHSNSGIAVVGALSMIIAAGIVAAQSKYSPASLNESGHLTVDGHSVPYLIRHLPASSFPELPDAVQTELNRRGCLIPQTYEAHRPENVIHGSFEQPGSSDWAVLCSNAGTVSLLVFFAGAPENPVVLAGALETKRLQASDAAGVLGFNWGIDPATPERVREVQIGMEPRPARLDHDCVADSVIEHRTVYHYFTKGGWTLVDTRN